MTSRSPHQDGPIVPEAVRASRSSRPEPHAPAAALRPHDRWATLLHLQGTAGNAAVSTLLGAVPGKTDGAAADADRILRQGSVDMVVGEPSGKGLEEGAEDHADDVRMQVQAGLALSSSSRAAGDLPEAKTDAVSSTLAFASTTTRSGSVSPFGAEHVTYSVKGGTWRTSGGGTIWIDATVDVATTWNTNSGGNTHVGSGADPVVAPATWRAIADDLAPDASGRPCRTAYWAADLTERHERFHAADDIARARLYLPAAIAWLNTQTIDVSFFDFLTSRRVRALLELVRQRIEADGWAWYDAAGGAGGNRAYADGKAAYQVRADDVRGRAAREGWA